MTSKKELDPLQILFCANEDYAQHLGVTLASLVLNNPDEDLNITVIGNLSPVSRKKLLSVANLSARSHLKFLEPSAIFADACDFASYAGLPTQGDYQVKGAYSSDIYTRLFVSRIFNLNIRRVLYLDCDLVVNGPLRPLWEASINPYTVAGVRIPWFDRDHLPNIGPGDPYINSGVLLFNMPVWRARDAEQRVLGFIHRYADRLRDPDQDALNAALAGEISFLHGKWNVLGPFLGTRYREQIGPEYQEDIITNAKIYHFNGGDKPWLYLSYNSKKHLYYKYIQHTPWHNYRPPDKTLPNILYKSASNFTPKAFKAVAKNLLHSSRSVGSSFL